MLKRRGMVTGILVILLAAGAVWAGDSPSKAAKRELDRGYQAARRGYWEEAMARYKRGSELDPTNARIWNNLAVALEAVGKYDDARNAYARALEIDPGNRRIKHNQQQFEEFYSTYIAKDDKKPPEEATEDTGKPPEGKPTPPPARGDEEAGHDSHS